MAIELHFCKTDNTPWGFRLTGGADCDYPLTVIKVAEGSIAENAGLQVDDVIVRINENSTAGLTHIEAHDAFLAAGPEFRIAVRRGDEITVPHEEQNNEEISNILEGSPKEFIIELQEEHIAEKESLESYSKFRVSDEQIAEAISGETELLPDQNVLGVNFNKVDLTESTVLKVINEETTEPKIDLENKKWSTFLQKPKTPKIAPRKKEPEGPTAPPYRVIIKKQPKKCKETPIKTVEEQTSPILEIQETDAVDLQGSEDECEGNAVESVKDETETELTQTLEEEILDDKIMAEEEVSGYSDDEMDASSTVDETIAEKVTTEASVTLEEQLEQVQQQLQALAQLPSAIQVSLDAVTQQLAKIVKSTHKEEEETTAEQTVAGDQEETEEFLEGERGDTYEEEASDTEIQINDEANYQSDTSERGCSFDDDQISTENCEPDHEECVMEEEQEMDEIDIEKAEQQGRKLIQMEEFHQRRLEQRPTHPLTPLQRPIILPGGRRWSQPNDALPTPRKQKMTDEKISSTIENYSEVITGRTKGINFLKYQPPPKNLDYLQHSEVFRLIHDTETSPRGIAARPGMIASEQDYYSEQPYPSGQQTSVEI